MDHAQSPERLVADACRILTNADLVELFTGHVSLLVGEEILIPAHLHNEGRGLESITSETITRVDRSGTRLSSSEPPGEIPIHTNIFEKRDDVKSVVHAHPTYATGMSIAQEPIAPASLDAALFGEGVPVYDPGPKLIHDDEEGVALAAALGGGQAILIRGHGAVTVGASIAESTARMYLLERAAKLQAIATAGGTVEPFDVLKGDEGFSAESSEEFYDEVFAFLRRKYVE